MRIRGNPMKTTFRALLVVSLVPLLAPALPGQTTAQPAPAPTPKPLAAPAEDLRVDLDFPGGTVSEFVTALRKVNSSFSVIGEKGDMETVLPSFSVRRAEPNQLAAALNSLLQVRGIMLNGYSVNGPYALLRVPAGQRMQGLGFSTFQLAPFLGEQSEKDIVDAIRSAWLLDPEHRPDQLRMQYHPATTLLLVSGNPDAQAVASQVVANLKRHSPEKPPTPTPAPPAK